MSFPENYISTDNTQFIVEKSRNFNIIVDGKQIDIKEDITPYESTQLMMMLLIGSRIDMYSQPLDYEWFINQHNLSRHFRTIDATK